eukprot:COSAG04_NODE_9_length_43480_cov_106.113806_17_plen_325_part_00
MLCAAHKHNIRVVDWDIAGGMSAANPLDSTPSARRRCSPLGRRRYFPYEIANYPRKVSNRTAMKIYIQLLVNEMVSYGIDGFALDLEGDTYANLEQNATDRQAFTDFLVELKAAMAAVVPGSVLHAWVSYTGAPWNSLFTKPQIAAALASVDRFLLMEYSMCSVLVANAPLPFIAEQFKTALALGFPAERFVFVLGWWGCDFPCGANGTCAQLRGPLRYRHGADELDNVPLGYAEILPKLQLSREQGQVASVNATTHTVHFQCASNAYIHPYRSLLGTRAPGLANGRVACFGQTRTRPRTSGTRCGSTIRRRLPRNTNGRSIKA